MTGSAAPAPLLRMAIVRVDTPGRRGCHWRIGWQGGTEGATRTAGDEERPAERLYVRGRAGLHRSSPLPLLVYDPNLFCPLRQKHPCHELLSTPVGLPRAVASTFLREKHRNPVGTGGPLQPDWLGKLQRGPSADTPSGDPRRAYGDDRYSAQVGSVATGSWLTVAKALRALVAALVS